MAKRRNEKTVSLFPFLAVLVCTMGALILLLLVTTRRIRQKQQHVPADVLVVQSAEHLPDPVEAEPIVALAAISESVAARAELAITRIRRAAIGKALDDQRRQHAAELQQRERHQRKLADSKHLLETVQEMVHSASLAADAETRQMSDLRQLQTDLEQRLNGVRQSIDQSLAEMAAAESLATAAEKLVNRRHSALQSLRDLSMQQKDRPADTAVAETVIDFSNSAGTARTPIVIDVTDQGFVFTATKVHVTKRDMDGVSATDNPLLSGVLAIHRERSSDSVTSRPYVLLLVRPGGTLAFYTAQRILREARVHFGYELMTDEQVIAAAKPVAGETQAVRAAVLNSLLRRDKRLEATSSIRRRIAALRDAERRPGRRGRVRIAPEFRRQYVGEPFEESDVGKGGANPFVRDADLSKSESSAGGRDGIQETQLSPVDVAQESPGEQSDASGFPEAPAEVWQSIPSIAEAGTHVEEELAKALAAREASRSGGSLDNSISAGGRDGIQETQLSPVDVAQESPGEQSDASGFPEAPAEVWQSIPSIAEAGTHVEEELAKALAAREASRSGGSLDNSISAGGRDGIQETQLSPVDVAQESPGEQSDASGFPEAPAEVWQSIPSIAEAGTHVEEELAKALAAREASRSGGSLDNSISAGAPQRVPERLSTIRPEGPRSAANDTAPSADEWSEHFPTRDPVSDKFWTAMQPLSMQPTTERPRNEWSSRTESAANQLFRLPAQDGQAYRPHDTPQHDTSSSARPHGPSSRTTATTGGSGLSNRLVSYEQVTVYLDPQHYTIVGHRPLALHGQAINQIVGSLAGSLFEISSRSPHPLAEMTLPAAKFVVSPGAHTLYLQLAAELHDLNIPVSSIVSLDAHVIDRAAGSISVMTSPVHRVASQVSSTKELP